MAEHERAAAPGAAGVFVGTSGWQYRDWRGTFYQGGVPAARWLEEYARTFVTVEANGTFYRLPERATFASWRDRTPRGFEVAVKASRYLTHVRKLAEPKEPVDRLVDRASALKNKLGPILLQLPPTMARDLDRLEATLRAFPSGQRVAVEFRHDSWIERETAALLRRYNAATCLADRRGALEPRWHTADWGYVRFHEGRASPSPRYGRRALAHWAERLAEQYEGQLVYAYFNNDAGACAPRNALEFVEACRRLGLAAPLADDVQGAA